VHRRRRYLSSPVRYVYPLPTSCPGRGYRTMPTAGNPLCSSDNHDHVRRRPRLRESDQGSRRTSRRRRCLFESPPLLPASPPPRPLPRCRRSFLSTPCVRRVSFRLWYRYRVLIPPRFPTSPFTRLLDFYAALRCAAIYYAVSLLKSAAFKDHASESVHVDASRIIFALALPSESSFVFERSC